MTKIKIELVAPGQLIAGQPLIGRIIVNVRNKLVVTHIRVMISGRAFARVSRKVSSGDLELTETAWVKVPLIDLQSNIFDPTGHRAVLGPGEHNFDFQIPVQVWLPPSFEHGYGMNVRYTLSAVVQTDARVFADKKSKTAICCPGTFDPRLFDFAGRPLAPPVQVVGSKKFFLSRGGCEMTVVVPAAVLRSHIMPVRVSVVNRSSKTIKSITIKLVQTTRLCLSGMRDERAQRFARTTMPDSRVEPLQSRDMTFEYMVPDNMLQSLNIADTIFVYPALHVQCNVSAAANLRLIVPFEVSAPPAVVASTPSTAIVMSEYQVITGTGAVDDKELEFSNFGGDNDKEFDEDVVAPSEQNLPIYPPQSSRIRGDTVLARPGMPDAWKAVGGGGGGASNDDDDEDDGGGVVENAKFTCFYPGCGSSHNTAEDLTMHIKLDH